ncbi:MAG: beta-ketoacyl synthase N-terminal-like domain-containing protein [Acidobacteriota bacterium]
MTMEASGDGFRHDPRVWITGVGTICPLADRAESLHRALCAGLSGLTETRFDELPELGAQLAGTIDFAPRDYLPDGKLRPLDRVARLAISAAGLALADAGLSGEECDDREIGLVLGTMYCSLRTIVAFDRRGLEAGPKYVRPFDFANTVINAAAGQTAIWHHLRGVNSTIAGGTAAGLEALAYAADLIRTGRSEVVLAGGCDELSFESFFSFHRAGLLCGPGERPARPVPFDARRNGFALAEGATLLVLESAPSARRRGARVLGEILGHASGFDPSRGQESDASRQHIARTVSLALADAALDIDEVDAVAASANGGRVDTHEALGLADAFRSRDEALPVSAVKSMLGESLGGSGALQTLSMLESLRAGELPGIPGLETASHDRPEVLSFADHSRRFDMRRGLVSAVGLDGNLCALVVEGGEVAA